MFFLSSFDGRSVTLRAQILAAERRIKRRRKHIRVAVSDITANVKGQVISPATIITAGLFGASLHRTHLLRGARLLATIQTAEAGLRLFLAATSRPAHKVD